MPTNQVQANPAIRPKGPVTPKDVADIVECFAQGLGVADTARKLGLSTNQVTRAKKEHALTSKPPANADQLKQASEAFSAKARRHRHERYDRLQKITDKMLSDLEEDLFATGRTVITVLRGVQGIESEVRVEKIPARDLRERIAAYNLSEGQLQKMEALEDDQGLARGLSMLEKFRQAAEVLAGGTLPPPREGLIQE